MNRCATILSIVFIAALAGSTVSCTKRVTPETPFTRIQGKWKKVRYATDDNDNKKIEPIEIHAVLPIEEYYIRFGSDGMGEVNSTYNGVLTTLNFNWAVAADSVKIDYDANYTISYHISDVTPKYLTLTAVTPLGLSRYYFDKQ